MTWISVSDRLPETLAISGLEQRESDWVLAWLPEWSLCCVLLYVEFRDAGWWVDHPASWEQVNGVTHWMPLPEPPPSVC